MVESFPSKLFCIYLIISFIPPFIFLSSWKNPIQLIISDISFMLSSLPIGSILSYKDFISSAVCLSKKARACSSWKKRLKKLI